MIRRPPRSTRKESSAASDVYKRQDLHLLKDYITETGKILPARITGVSAKVQRKITKAVKTARFLALLPYSDNHN